MALCMIAKTLDKTTTTTITKTIIITITNCKNNCCSSNILLRGVVSGQGSATTSSTNTTIITTITININTIIIICNKVYLRLTVHSGDQRHRVIYIIHYLYKTAFPSGNQWRYYKLYNNKIHSNILHAI